ncbi:MAG: hypothetical protein PHX09_04450 [Clostridia bacterium]|nr:hypothetical protein [Clostridia bacterium]
MENYSITDLTFGSKNRFEVKFEEKNKKNETLLIHIDRCEGSNSQHSLPKLWFKNGWTKKELTTYWHISTYVKNESGCWGLYNPQQKLHESGGRYVVDFDWMFEATEGNKEKLINEVYRRFMNAQ